MFRDSVLVGVKVKKKIHPKGKRENMCVCVCLRELFCSSERRHSTIVLIVSVTIENLAEFDQKMIPLSDFGLLT